ncbi:MULTISPECIES: ATP-binding protein [Rhodococcus]|uniref:ATP-binding protein n=1 Tax=Rhodococcus TaxID=1827 RepID=UPI00135842ED|nr:MULTISPECIES: ATP-binding protein [Rhodococcus]KAF0956737.1 ATP-dependent zinc metalloprotease FtsH [Rhodococcus sp. T7]KAF0966610.1 ATP-dependent zinc metalloprotease FtsH [Rhodococcus sp. T7]UOT08373.1 ATP-binding protein [Rhodococcus opacus]
MSDATLSQPAHQVLGDLIRRLAELAGDPTMEPATDGIAVALQEEPPANSAGFDRICSAFRLSAFERELVMLVGLPEEHETITHLARVLHPRGEPRMSFSTIAEVLGLGPIGRRHLRDAILAGPLHVHGLLVAEGSGPLPESGLRLAAGLWSVLRGHDHWPAQIRRRTIPAVASPSLDGARLANALDGGRRIVVVTAATRPPTELAAVVRGAAEAVGTRVVVVSSDDVTGEAQELLSVHTVAREAHPVLIGRPQSPPLTTHPGPVVICAEESTGLPLDDRPVVVIEVGERDLGESIDMWTGLVPELNGGAEHLASLLRVDHLRASRAVDDARVTARADAGPITVADIVRHARRRTGCDLPASGRIVRPTVGWDQLVTTPDNTELLRSILDRVRGQVRVLHDWGFESRASRGVHALFAGPPGTGKTLSAHIVASSLDLDLLVVDVSTLVSKWLGETEKNISEVFAAAERSQSVLFFDEADAIFGKRTDGNDAQARWANLETAHLLAKIDGFTGLVVLATNLRGNIDEAFVRRLDVIVEFDEPGPAERLRLWETHLPPAAPLADDVDLRQLASVYQLTGGLIRNAALAAAYRAAAGDRCIDQRGLLDAVEREYQKAGRSFPGIPRARTGTHSGGM